jgi:hypothetical protein
MRPVTHDAFDPPWVAAETPLDASKAGSGG